jgi:large subunit ribosomal protein L17
MRHGKRFNHLGRKTAHRKAMLANMACSLIEHKRINTTVAKAKALRQFVEPIITRSKDDSTHARRVVFRYLRSKHAVSELFRNVAPAISEREGGYTRIIKTGFRPGDSAEMCLIELVDFNDVYDLGSAKKTKRTRRGGAKKLEDAAVAAAPVAVDAAAADVVVAEAPKEEAVEEVVEAAVAEESTPEVAATEEETAEEEGTDDSDKAESDEEKKKDE